MHRWRLRPCVSRCRRRGEKRGAQEPADHALGYSRGGFGTKFHLLTDGNGIPLNVVVTAGQRHESQFLESVMDGVKVKRPVGRSRQRPKRLAGAKAYSNRRIRGWLRDRRVQAVIPTRSVERPRRFDRATYRRRNVVERCVGWLKGFRRIGTRSEKLAVTYAAMLTLAMIRVLLSFE
ncbi:MAG: IS5 family transposase [Planctomycetota bacterium]